MRLRLRWVFSFRRVDHRRVIIRLDWNFSPYILYGAIVKVHAFSTSRRLAPKLDYAREVLRDMP